ncbi:MAG: GNAT family N-acetyltransferase [Cytophagaceae bacterium]|nr:GNAT family N-acetyltransferase [Cytophagaceae bacterium]
MPPPILLRPWREGDQTALKRHANNRKIADNLRDVFPHPYTYADADWYIRQISGQEGHLNFAIEIAGEAGGGIGAVRLTDVYQASAEIGYWLGEVYWGQGITTEALRQTVPLVFAHWPGVERIFAGVFARNAASKRVLEKAGFTLEGVLRRAIIKNGTVDDVHQVAIWRDSYSG